ncbi:MAG: terminase large subunit [Candidatus Babeliales bacterium]|nr:terminase large subunit [Candidatus Babeliales bacterium]
MVDFETSIVFKQNYKSTANVVVNQGGTSSGKTFSILQVLFCFACLSEKQIITIVGQDIPNLKAGALRDALSIYDSNQSLKSQIKSYNKSDRIFQFYNGTLIEFKSYDNAQDAKSGKRDYLFINEANGITFDVYNELALRTKKRVFIDYNPNFEFWVHENLIGKPGVELIISDYRHNPFLPQSIKDKIEALKEIDIELWKVYARGATGKITGLILTNWFICDKIPDFAKSIGTGLDFGFTNHETAYLEAFLQDGEIWVNELIYETGLTNQDISRKLKDLKITRNREIIADSAEPKSIEELKREGWYIIAADKGPDSVKNSIDILKRYKINVTRNSVNLRKELGRYIWKKDRSGKSLNEPIKEWDHLIDCLRYIALKNLKIKSNGKAKTRFPFLGDNHLVSDFDKVK